MAQPSAAEPHLDGVRVAPACAVEARGLTRRFGRRCAVESVDLTLAAGECLALFGPNGAGKTTLLRLLAGLLKPTSGDARVNGVPLRGDAPGRAAAGFISHQSMLYDALSVRENVELTARLHALSDPRGAAERALAEMRITERADTPVRALSRGLQQRASIARAIVHAPRVLLLDEPYTGLDALGANALTELLERLRDGGAAMVLVTHNIPEGLTLATHAAVMHNGRFLRVDRREDVDVERFEEEYRRLVAEGVGSRESGVGSGGSGVESRVGRWSPASTPDTPRPTPHSRPSLLSASGLIARKDLAIEFRTRTAFFASLVFALLGLCIFYFAWDSTAVSATDLAPGVMWVVFTFSGLLGLQRSFSVEQTHRAIDGLLLTPTDREAVFIGKALANLVFVGGVQIVAIPALALFYNLPLASTLPVLFGIALLAAIGLVAVGTLFSAMAVNTRLAELLLPMLGLPFFVPIVMSAAPATARLLAGRPVAEVWPWLKILVAFDIVFLVACTLAFPYTLEE